MNDSDTFDTGKLYSPEAQQIFANFYDNLMLSPGEAPVKSVLICSADPGEGSTTVALGLALAAAGKQNPRSCSLMATSTTPVSAKP